MTIGNLTSQEAFNALEEGERLLSKQKELLASAKEHAEKHQAVIVILEDKGHDIAANLQQLRNYIKEKGFSGPVTDKPSVKKFK